MALHTQYNKANLTALIGVLCTAGALFFPNITAEKWAAIQGVLSTLMVFFVPNADPAP